MFESFVRSTCSLEQCTTSSGPCHDLNRLCCCRSQKTELLNLQCEEGITPGLDISRNETHCGCTVCDDISVKITVYVHEPGEDGDPISAARVIDSNTGDLLGLTYTNGLTDFRVTLSAKSIPIIVQAANYLSRKYVIKLKPTSTGIEVAIALAHRNTIAVVPGDSGYTFRLGNYVYITIPAGGFTKNGILYNDVVMFDGMFMDPNDEGFGEFVDGKQFILNGTYFALSFFTYTYFTTPEGDELQPERMNYHVKMDDPEQLYNENHLVTYNQDSEQWENLGKLTRSNSLEKRQSIVFEQLNIGINNFVGLIVEQNNITCWLQARTFDNAGEPILGFVITVEQDVTRNGQQFLFRFGTSTGGAQSMDDAMEMQLVENAVCLPLECTRFDLGTVEGNEALETPRSPITPEDFPEGTFSASEIGAPTVLGRFFTFQEVLTASQAGEPRPFYSNVSECIKAAQVSTADAPESSYFNFREELVVPVLANSSCFIKIRISECLRSEPNTIFLISTSSGIPTTFNVDYEMLAEEMFSGMHPDDVCIEAQRVACVPYPCNSIIQVTVLDDTGVNFCNVSSFSPVIQSPLLSGDSGSQRLTIQTGILTTMDYNDADLGIYNDQVPMIALDMCNDPTVAMNNPDNLTSFEGYAAIFDCIL